MKKNKIQQYYIIFYLIILTLLSRNTLISTTIIGFINSFIITFVLFIPVFVFFVNDIVKKKINLEKNKIIIIGIFVGSILISIILKRDWQLYNISILFYIISAIIITWMIEWKKFIKYYLNILLTLSIISLVVVYIVKPIIYYANLNEVIKNTYLYTVNSAGLEFINCGLGFAVLQNDYYRNFGIFTEPSIYQFYLIFAVVFILFVNKNKRKWDYIQIIIFTITILSTYSAAGIIVLILLLMVYIYKTIMIGKKHNRSSIIIISLLLILGLFVIFYTNSSMKNMIMKIFTKNESSLSRYGSVLFTIEKFIDSPLIGNRISEILEYENYLTNTSFSIMAIYGIIPFIISLYLHWKNSKKIDKSPLINIGIALILILSSNAHMFLGAHSYWLLCMIWLMKEEHENENTLDS